MTRKRFMLVYQGGIANVFQVRAFNLSDYGRNARRLYQGDFRGAEMFAAGLRASGHTVKAAACNKAGDIARETWTQDKDSQPFVERFGWQNAEVWR